MLDFTSSLYLGLGHASGSLGPWTQLTTGVPAALAPPPGAAKVAEGLAQLQGCERALLGPSTLHLFWDLFGMLAGAGGIALYVDQGAYPIAQWGMAQAQLRGVPVAGFPHRNAQALAACVERAPRRRPVVVADGSCACCGSPLPIDAYLQVIRPHGGLLVLDDTQGLGIWGYSPSVQAPYGQGGGGSLRRRGCGGTDVIVVCSLAKAFGAPVAALSGSKAMVECVEASSQTRVHCSAPSAAAIAAAAAALGVNELYGDDLRQLLAQRVRLFRERLEGTGIRATGGLFPVQRMLSLPLAAAQELHARLLRTGVRSVLQLCSRGGSGEWYGARGVCADSPAQRECRYVDNGCPGSCGRRPAVDAATAWLRRQSRRLRVSRTGLQLKSGAGRTKPRREEREHEQLACRGFCLWRRAGIRQETEEEFRRRGCRAGRIDPAVRGPCGSKRAGRDDRRFEGT